MLPIIFIGPPHAPYGHTVNLAASKSVSYQDVSIAAGCSWVAIGVAIGVAVGLGL